MTSRVEVVWCIECGARFTDEESKERWGCPKCNSLAIPCHCDADLRVEVNWHELHVLCVWAEQWARLRADKDSGSKSMPHTVAAIARRLQRQFPDLNALTLSQEVAELPAKLAASGIHSDGMETNIPRPAPILTNGPGAVGHSRAPETA
jgi:predicted  nucleic acid-binding Zn-ribbon protein